MKYVKLTAKPNTWFKEGTEVYDYDCREDNKKRITLKDYEKWAEYGSILCRGTRIVENSSEGLAIGDEHFDGENCLIEEFDVEIIEQ